MTVEIEVVIRQLRESNETSGVTCNCGMVEELDRGLQVTTLRQLRLAGHEFLLLCACRLRVIDRSGRPQLSPAVIACIETGPLDFLFLKCNDTDPARCHGCLANKATSPIQVSVALTADF